MLCHLVPTWLSAMYGLSEVGLSYIFVPDRPFHPSRQLRLEHHALFILPLVVLVGGLGGEDISSTEYMKCCMVCSHI